MRRIDRRTLLKTGAAFALTGIAGGCISPESSRYAGGTARGLPPRGEFVVRGATVLTMDERLGDLQHGDVHVRDGAIVALGRNIATRAQSIDATGMICMPGFIDTHWHLWTSVCRAMIELDDPKRGYFPVTNALGQHYTPED